MSVLSSAVNAKDNIYYVISSNNKAINEKLLSSDMENMLSNAGFNPVQGITAITESGFLIKSGSSASFGGIGDVSFGGIGIPAVLSYVCVLDTGNLEFLIGATNTVGRAGIENDDVSRGSSALDKLNSNLLRQSVTSMLDMILPRDQKKVSSIEACNELKQNRIKNQNHSEADNKSNLNKRNFKDKYDSKK